ncbi:MAG: Transglutaminase-like superfamily [Acidobacteriota bacterium]|nr:Transglutaminase-like superfamily [Acidobacteriota bacterium]
MMQRLLAFILAGLALVLLALGAGEAFVQHRQDERVRAATAEALGGDTKTDFVSKVTTLRDYVRTHVRNIEFSAKGRPFLRNTAAESLQTGKGRCGEASRVFINMALSAGIPAQRLYLDGSKAHVVAVVRDENGNRLVVDATERYYFPDVEPFDGLKRHQEFDSYSTFNWRRLLGTLRKFPSNFVSLGPLVYILENPHALIACLCFISSATSLLLAALIRRRLPRRRSPNSKEKFSVPARLEGESAEAGL